MAANRIFKVERLAWRDQHLRTISLPGGALVATLGLGSGLARRPGDPPGRLWALGDRGPNLKVKQAMARFGLAHLAPLSALPGAKIMPLPDIGPSLSEIQVAEGRVDLISTLRLRRGDGVPLSGLPLPHKHEASMEPLFDLEGRALPMDGGADTEAVVALADGSFWVAEEYGPSLLKVDVRGVIHVRWTPVGVTLADAGYPVLELLPAIARRRRLNRGFEGLAISADETELYVAFQSALETPDEPKAQVRIWTLDAATGALLAERWYPFDALNAFQRDAAAGPVEVGDLKIGELLWAGPDRLLVLERMSHTSKIYLVDLKDSGAPSGRPLQKELILDSDEACEIVRDIEGMALLSDREILLVNDNDFGIEDVETQFFKVTFDQPII